MIQVKNLCVSRGEFSLSQIDFEIHQSDYVVLVGPTGTGKSTLLEAIVGLRAIGGGQILFRNRPIQHLRSGRREIGYVPQDMGLFPKMSVADQIDFPLLVRRISGRQRRYRVDQLIEEFALKPLRQHQPSTLSGGERQRVAIARAIAAPPKLLCLDEPLSAIDVDLRQKLVDVIDSFRQLHSIPVLHVTHQIDDLKSVEHRRLDFPPLVNVQ